MKKIVIIPDSFKGTLSSAHICSIVAEQARKHHPQAEVISIPVADGGEGSVDALISAAGGRRIACTVQGPYTDKVDAFFGLLTDGTAVVEMAAAAGLPLVGHRKNPLKTSTYGVGQLIEAALAHGANRLIIALGGSATNDGGTGAAAALGVRFYDAAGNAFVPVGQTLSQIDRIDASGLLKPLRDLEVVTMCDISNPLCGPNGAAVVFGPQKGADEAAVQLLDAGLCHLARCVSRDLGQDILTLPGSGAAGGMGGGTVAFFGASLQLGIETVLDTVGFDQLVEGADLVVSGEGKIDRSSLGGKVVIGVARRTKEKHIPLVALVGDIGDDLEAVYDAGVWGIFSINRVAIPFEQARRRAASDLALTSDNLFRFLAGLANNRA